MPVANTLISAGAVAGSLLFGLRPVAAQNPAEALLAAERTASEASARSTFAAAIVGALASDGTILWPGAPVVVGPASVQRLLSAQRLLDSLRITWQPLGAELSADATVGATWGVAAAARDGSAPQLGRYIAAWRMESGSWKLAAFVGIGIYPLQSTILPSDAGPLRLPPIPARGSAAAFIAADLAFSRLAGDSGAAVAFGRYAAPEAFMFGGGIPNRGPDAIRRSFEGGPPSTWAWHPVLAGASASGELGYTVGEAVITSQGGPARYSKYLTIWRRLPDGAVRYLTDGGNARPATP
jgi:hypothetical protein